MKVLLILFDGMRPDAICDFPYVKELMKKSTYTMNAKTVMPSVTLPCHMSLFHSVDPSRHGIASNTYVPQVRPVNGLYEVLYAGKKKGAMFYSWEELRDLARPGKMSRAEYVRGNSAIGYGYDKAGEVLAEMLKGELEKPDSCDFIFFYFGWPDGAGHGYGWMGDEYIHSLTESWKIAEDIIENISDEYCVIVTADHGGHDRTHGTEMPEDMTIPMFFKGAPFEAGKEIENVSIKDIAPTIVKLLDVEPDEEWEGKSII